MASYSPTFTTSTLEEKGLDWSLEIENARRAALDPPDTPLTKAELLQQTFDSALGDYARQWREEVRRRIGLHLDTLTPEELATLATQLGVAIP